MQEIHPNIFFVPGANQSRFPFCSCLYIKGRDIRVLIDAGMGSDQAAPCLEMGVDLLILSHCHIDHRLTAADMPDLPMWCHEEEAKYLRETAVFLNGLGVDRRKFDMERFFPLPPNLNMTVRKTLTHGERIDLGGLTLEVIHTPGHTPGHLAFFIPEADLLFAADVDLTPFGPFYGHQFAEIGDFIQSIRQLKSWKATTVLTGHAGPFQGHQPERFDAYEAMIYRRDRLVLDRLQRPRSLESFWGQNLIYPVYPDPPDLIRWFEQVHIEKQLERLRGLGLVRNDDGLWMRTD